MKKVYFMLFVLLLLSGNIFSQIQLETSTKAYILDRCQGDANVLKTVKANSTVMFLKLSDCSDLFYKIEYNGVEGYIHKKLIKQNEDLTSYLENLKSENDLITKDSIIKENTNKEDRQSTYRSSSSERTIHTGPRGGRYYINSKGNKTYVKRR